MRGEGTLSYMYPHKINQIVWVGTWLLLTVCVAGAWAQRSGSELKFRVEGEERIEQSDLGAIKAFFARLENDSARTLGVGVAGDTVKPEENGGEVKDYVRVEPAPRLLQFGTGSLMPVQPAPSALPVPSSIGTTGVLAFPTSGGNNTPPETEARKLPVYVEENEDDLVLTRAVRWLNDGDEMAVFFKNKEESQSIPRLESVPILLKRDADADVLPRTISLPTTTRPLNLLPEQPSPKTSIFDTPSKRWEY